MPLSSPIDFSTRAEDKGFDLFGSPLDDHFNDFFDQYVNEDSLESSDDNKELDITIDFDNLFGAGTSSSSIDSILPYARHKPSSPEPWRKGLWCLNDPAALPTNNLTTLESQTNSHGLASPASFEALSLTTTGLGLPSLEAELSILSTTLPSTPPTTPCRKITKNILAIPKTIRRRDPNDRRRLFHRSSMSPTLMSKFSKSDISLDEWTANRLQNFHLQVPDEELPPSPPPSTRVMQHDVPSRLTVPQPRVHQNGMMQNGEDRHLQMLNSPDQQQHLISSPTMSSLQNQTSFLAQAMTTSASFSSPTTTTREPFISLPQAVQQAHLLQSHSIHPWQSAPLDLTEFSYGASHDLQSNQAQTWWQQTSSVSAVQPCATPLQPSGYYQLAQPTPQRLTHGLVQGSESPFAGDNSGEGLMHAYGGLMTQYGSHHEAGANAPSSHYSSSALPPIMTNSSDYPPLPAAGQDFARGSPFKPNRRRQRTPPSRSPSASPTNTSRIEKNRVSPPATAHPHSTRSSRRQSHGRRAKSAGTTPKTPVTPGFASVDFVNFTAQDSKKILTGVAPSGSSKTKARREQEAREKRRKLGEAALKAVQNRDMEALEAVLY
jgi:hypothetical protein